MVERESKPKIILGIHGLANKPEKDVLTQYWKNSIVEGLKKNEKIESPEFKFHLVYWADLRYPIRLHDDPQGNQEFYNEEPYLEDEKDVLKRYDAKLTDVARGIGTTVVGKIADHLSGSKILELFIEQIMEKMAEDLDYYYSEDKKLEDRADNVRVARQVLMDELETALLEVKDHQILLLSHSMGTIIAYDVLHKIAGDNRNFKLSHFVTLGSPLGLASVKKRVLDDPKIFAPKKQLATPDVVTKDWTNFADPGDKVAVDNILGDDYGPNRVGIAVRGDLVNNDYVGLSKEPNPHKSYGYLRAPEVSEYIAGFLKS